MVRGKVGVGDIVIVIVYRVVHHAALASFHQTYYIHQIITIDVMQCMAQ